jgi:hypothetical protein
MDPFLSIQLINKITQKETSHERTPGPVFPELNPTEVQVMVNSDYKLLSFHPIASRPKELSRVHRTQKFNEF